MAANQTDMEVLTTQMLIFKAAENTGMHGLPNVTRAKGLTRKCAWLIIFLGGVGKFPYNQLFRTIKIHNIS